MSKIEDGNTAIKFPDQHYVNFQSRPTSDNVPLGFMTPDGTDKAALKRKETVDTWAKGYDYQNKKPKEDQSGVVYKNEPMVGFKLSREIRRYASFGQGNVKWRIEDPRGFELEISSPNFAQIISLCNLEKGEIQESCIWGRLGAENVLVPVDSDAYRVAMANTQRVAKKASLRDLKLGDYVIMQNGDEGTYMGIFYFMYGNWSHNAMTQEASDKKRYVFKDKSNEHHPFFAVASPKMSEIRPGDGTLTQEAAEKEINEVIKAKRKESNYSSGIRESSYSRIVAATSTPPKKSNFIVTKTPEVDFATLAASKKSGGYWGMLGTRLISFDMKNYHDICARNRNGFDKVWITEWDQAKLSQDEPEFEIIKPRQTGGWNQRDDHMTPHTHMPERVWSYKIRVQTEHSGVIDVRRDD